MKMNNLSSLSNKEITDWGVRKINAPSMWSHGYTGKNIKIAILDTGIDFSHPDLKASIQEGFNAIDPEKPPRDDNGHGSLVAGIISATHNQIGIKGIAPSSEIYPVKVLDKFGEGTIEAVISGLNWCISKNIRLINMSFSLQNDNKELRDTIQKAIDAGIIIIASGSNSTGGIVGYPATYHNVISVTSVNKRLKVGKTSPTGKIDFAVPGVDIISTGLFGSYKKVTGTSFAAPHLTGIIALLLSKEHNATQPSIIEDLKKLSLSLGDDKWYGNGIVIIK